MKPSNLVRRYEEDWQMATRHPFLEAVRYGKLDAAIFATWLVQDYLFVKDEFSCQARLLARAPRRTQKLLLSGLQGLEAELTWFEVQAWERDLALDAKRYPATAAYDDFLQSLDQKPYAIAMAAIWAIERAYLESWQSALPGNITYRDYIEHWANPEFENFVSQLEAAAADALQEYNGDEEVEAVFLAVVRLEYRFWEMAWNGSQQEKGDVQ